MTAKKVVRRIAAGETGVHAILLYGVRGCGKSELAEALAEAWLCRSLGPEGACGTCQPCRAFARGTNADLLRIVPQPPSNIIRREAIVESDNPSNDDPIPIRSHFRVAPLMSRNKVVIITDAHRMNGDASNALLKTLEEPNPQAKLVLTTDSVGGVLPTILSRCLAVACDLPSPDEVRDLVPGADASDIQMAEGAPGRVVSILKHPGPYRDLAALAASLHTRTFSDALKVSEQFRQIAESLVKATGSGARNANAEALDMLAASLARDPQADPRWTHYVIETHRRIRQNASPQISFDALFCRILRPGR